MVRVLRLDQLLRLLEQLVPQQFRVVVQPLCVRPLRCRRLSLLQCDLEVAQPLGAAPAAAAVQVAEHGWRAVLLHRKLERVAVAVKVDPFQSLPRPARVTLAPEPPARPRVVHAAPALHRLHHALLARVHQTQSRLALVHHHRRVQPVRAVRPQAAHDRPSHVLHVHCGACRPCCCSCRYTRYTRYTRHFHVDSHYMVCPNRVERRLRQLRHHHVDAERVGRPRRRTDRHEDRVVHRGQLGGPHDEALWGVHRGYGAG